jgi:glutathione S-transferase
MYQVIGNVRSRAFRVFWTLEEMGLDYEHVNEGPGSDRARALNPSGKVPVLVVDGTPVPDSCAIMTYLADKHGQLTYPAGTLDRARQDALLHQINDEIDAVLWTAARHSFVLPEDKRVPAVKDSLRWEFERNATRISEAMQGEFLMGETMTIADILLAHCLNWASTAKFTIPTDELLAYRKRMISRPAFQKVLAL